MAGHLERVTALIARGDVEGAKYAHNSGVVRAARSKANDRTRKLAELRQAKAAIDAASRK